MFWRFGGYANISTIDTILDKENFTLEELLDESDLIQELKQPNSKLIEYLREEKVLEKLLDYAVAPRLEVFETTDDQDDESGKGKNRLLSFSRPRASSRTTDATENEDDEADKKRNRYAFVSCEILSSDTWSIYEALTENRELIRNFWNFLQRESPLDPLQASYFTKINESLFEKKTDEMMDLLRSLPDPVGDLLKHVECPMVMDLLLKIIALDRNEGGQGVVEWLYSKNIIPTLLSFLSPEHSWVVQTAAGDFIKAIITISANASQNEQQCIGPNELTRQLVSRECVERLVGYMLGGGNALTVGVGIIIEVIRKNNSDYDPDVGAGNSATPSAHDPIYLGTLLRMFAENVPKFMDLVLGSSAEKERADSTFGQRLEPLGFDRFKTCELMAELLHCSNMGLLNEVGSEQLIAARDAERQRMRDDGKLGPTKDEDVSTDDLTMRSTQTGQEEARRLEVTNADDDGFEEVEPSKEMSEDTSHEFVKAEAETSPGQQPSLLGKDEDDFVDEPLSPSAPPSGANKPQLDDPELVVAPLSPTKLSAAQPDSTDDASDSTQPSADEANETSEKDAVNPGEKPQTSLTSESPPDEGGLALPVTGPAGGSSKAPAPSEGPLSPHPEDTPAPLFSAPSAPGSGAAKPPQTPGKTTEDTQNDQSATLPVDEQDEKTAPASTEPVVGDFLKMQFVDHNVVPTILSFFFSYPWNNFLHNVVYDIVQQVFNGPMDRGCNPALAISLFEAADITAAIIKGQQASDESHSKTKTRMGYMGHLTLIAEEVVKFTERHPPELLSDTVLNKVMSEEWINYVEGALAETRERDNAILGGVRPEVALGHRGSLSGAGGLGGIGLSGLTGNTSGGQSNALSDAGLNGGIELNSDGGGNGIGPFAISAGTLMSGFGSSSDEDDEEGDVDEEDINSEFRAYTDPSNADSSLAPPSIPPPPPPPPPLNIPPSRARRQLAARLALHQKNNNETAEPSSASHHDENEGGDDDDDDLKDPFADGEDDLDDDDDILREDGRDSWWRGVVRRKANEEERNSDEDNDDEFGDFAMAEDNDERPDENVVLRPLAVNPAKDGNRSLSGLWPFSTRSEQAAPNETESGGESLSEKKTESEATPSAAVEVKEAKRRTSIEDPDDDEPVKV